MNSEIWSQKHCRRLSWSRLFAGETRDWFKICIFSELDLKMNFFNVGNGNIYNAGAGVIRNYSSTMCEAWESVKIETDFANFAKNSQVHGLFQFFFLQNFTFHKM